MYPILFEFGIITVFSLWFFVALGFIVAAALFVRLAKRYRIRLTLLNTHGVILFIWTLIVSRLTFILLHTDFYFYRFNILDLFAVWDKGLSFWGAVIAWTVGLLYFSKKAQQSPWTMWDIMIPSILIGMAFASIGTLLDGVNYGTPTSLPWGITFRNANVKYISAVHPTQIFAALYTFALGGGMLMFLKKFRGQIAGAATEIGIAAYGFFRFIEEFFRGDDTITIFTLRVPQLLALAVLITSGYFIYQRYTNKNGKDPEGLLKKWITDFRTCLIPSRFKKTV